MAIGDDLAGPGQRPGALTGRVRVSAEHNTELVVQCVFRSTAEIREATTPPESLLVIVARLATAIARGMADERIPLNRLRVRATVTTSPAPVETDDWIASVVLDMYGEGPQATRADLERCLLYTSPSPRDS